MAKKKDNRKLTSVKLQMMINMKTLNTELWCPVLRFGRGSNSRFKFPIVFKNSKKAHELCDELIKLKGKTVDQVREASDKLYEKYKKYNR